MQNANNKFPMTDITLKLIETDRKGCIWLVLFIIEKSEKDYFQIPYIETSFDNERHLFDFNKKLLDQLTATEKEVLFFFFGNYSNNEIAELIFKSPQTVRSHLQSIYSKFNVNNKFDLQKKILL